MSELSDIELEKDISNALDVFDGIIENSKWTFVYTYGSYNDSLISVAKSMGVIGGFGTDVAVYNPEIDDIFKIPRLVEIIVALEEKFKIERPVTPASGGYGVVWERLHKALY